MKRGLLARVCPAPLLGVFIAIGMPGIVVLGLLVYMTYLVIVDFGN